MYKLIKMMLVILSFINISLVSAQTIPIKIGDNCPEELLLFLKSKSPIDNHKKAILIDFWATWCAPCVTSLPKLDSLQKEYSAHLKIISVTDENESIVSEVVNKIFPNGKSNLNIVTNEKYLRQFFPYRTIPHYVWIDTTGKVIAITEEVNKKDIQKFIHQKELTLNIKREALKINFELPLYKQIENENKMLYHSMIMGYRPDIVSYGSRKKNFVTMTNANILQLFQVAYGKFDLAYLDLNVTKVNGLKTDLDSAAIGYWKPYESMKKKYVKERDLFSYEIAFPDSVSNDKLFEFMQEDLNRYFGLKGITAHMEKAAIKVLKLVYLKGSKSDAFIESSSSPVKYTTEKSLKMINQPMPFFMSQLLPFLQEQKIPLKNGTGYDGKVSMELNVDFNSISSVNKALAVYNLQLKEIEELSDVIIIDVKPITN